jgi:hypothetical protein
LKYITDKQAYKKENRGDKRHFSSTAKKEKRKSDVFSDSFNVIFCFSLLIGECHGWIQVNVSSRSSLFSVGENKSKGAITSWTPEFY